MNPSGNKIDKNEIRGNMEIFWRDQMTWADAYIVSLLTDRNNISYYNRRIFENIDRMREFLSKYYTYEEALTVAVLLQTYALMGIKYLIDYRIGDTASAAYDYRRWIESVDIIASYLSKINPYWDEETIKTMLDEHTFYTAHKIARYAGKRRVPKELPALLESQASNIAQYMADGMISQFSHGNDGGTERK